MMTDTNCVLVVFLLSFTLLAQATVEIIDYRFPIPNQFNGSSETATGGNFCSVISLNSTNDALDCFAPSKLVDNELGSPNFPLMNLNQFFAWNRTQAQPVTLQFGFTSPVSSLNSVVLYFYNSPAQQIGLPMITLRGSTMPSGESPFNIAYFYENNNALTNSDSQLRNVSLSITSNIANTTVLFIDLVFTNTIIDWILLSEVDIFSGAPNVNPTEITFQDGQSETVSLGPNNPQSSVRLSCTVAVSGLFQWSWQHNGNSLLSSDRYQILTGDATRSSILVINKLSYTDEGTYSCAVNHVSQTASRVRNVTLQLQTTIEIEQDFITLETGQNVTLDCEMYGYLRGKIEWLKNGQQVQSGGRYSITVRTGSREGQDGGEDSVSSVVSQLTIQEVEEGDEGIYTCRVRNIQSTNFVALTVISNVLSSVVVPSQTFLSSLTSPPSTTSLIPVATITPSTSPQASSEVFPIEGIIGIVIGLILLAILILLLSCCCYMIVITRKSKTGSRDLVSPEEPAYAEIKKRSPRPRTSFSVIPLLEAEDVPDGRIGRRSLKPESPTSPDPPTYQEIEDVAKPMKISAAANIIPSIHNPMYQSGDPMSTLGITSGSIPSLTNISYTSMDPIPPPVPPYRPSPGGFNVPIGPSMFSTSGQNSTTSLSSDHYLTPYPSAYVEPAALKKPDVPEVTHENMKKIKDLGEGRFGPVLLAHTVDLSLKDLGLSNSSATEGISILVAVKTLKNDCETETKESFERELKFLGRLKHENVVRLMGVCQTGNSFIMLEYMENGDLSQYLQDKELTTQETRPLPNNKVNVQLLTYMCLQIANGMRYLASLHFIHRDLAARNCYVGAKYKVKIADFGMSHNLYSSVYYRLQGKAMLPIRWMANECFYGQFSEKTDVWAFGITMWEIFTFCKSELFEGMTDQEVIDDAFQGPDRILPASPDICPPKVYQVMQQCWIHEPEKRASFDELYTLLLNIHSFSDSAYSL